MCVAQYHLSLSLCLRLSVSVCVCVIHHLCHSLCLQIYIYIYVCVAQYHISLSLSLSLCLCSSESPDRVGVVGWRMRRFIMRDTHAPSPLLLRGAQNTGGSSSGLRLEKLAKVFVVAFVGIVVLRYALIGAEQDMKRALHTKLDAAVSWPDASGGDCGGEPRAQRRGGHGRARASGRARSERSVHRDAFTYSVAVMTYPGRTNRIQMLERTVRRIAFETPNSVEIIIFSGTEEDDEMLELVDVLCDSIIAGTGRGNGDEDMFRHDDAGKCRVEGILIPPIDAYLDEGVSSDRRDLRTNANYWNILKTLSARPPWSSWEGFVVVEDDVWLASGFHEILRWYANSMISSLSQPFLSHVHAR